MSATDKQYVRRIHYNRTTTFEKLAGITMGNLKTHPSSEVVLSCQRLLW